MVVVTVTAIAIVIITGMGTATDTTTTNIGGTAAGIIMTAAITITGKECCSTQAHWVLYCTLADFATPEFPRRGKSVSIPSGVQAGLPPPPGKKLNP